MLYAERLSTVLHPRRAGARGRGGGGATDLPLVDERHSHASVDEPPADVPADRTHAHDADLRRRSPSGSGLPAMAIDGCICCSRRHMYTGILLSMYRSPPRAKCDASSRARRGSVRRAGACAVRSAVRCSVFMSRLAKRTHVSSIQLPIAQSTQALRRLRTPFAVLCSCHEQQAGSESCGV
eukprot:COSAG02_NODE_8186_length_2670_cov_2.377674_1_plen_181_part_00